MLHRYLLCSVAGLAAAFFPLRSADAQILVLPSALDGELTDEQRSDLQQTLVDVIREVASDGTEVLTESDLPEPSLASDCESAACFVELGNARPMQAIVRATVYSAAEIYDVNVEVFAADSGERLDQEVTDCTFCLFEEASEAFGFAARSVLARVTLPDPTSGPPAAAATTTEPVADTQPEQATSAAAPAWIAGDIEVVIQAQPASAEIRVNGSIAGRGTATLSVAPQTLQITLDALDHEPLERPIVVSAADADSTIRSYFAMARQSGSGGGTSNDADSFNQRSVGGILMGTGVAVLVGGIVALTMDGNSSCSEGPLSACASIYETTGLGTALTVIGAASTGVGAAFFATAGSSPDRAASASVPRRRFTVLPTASGARVLVGGRF